MTDPRITTIREAAKDLYELSDPALTRVHPQFAIDRLLQALDSLAADLAAAAEDIEELKRCREIDEEQISDRVKDWDAMRRRAETAEAEIERLTRTNDWMIVQLDGCIDDLRGARAALPAAQEPPAEGDKD